MNLKLIESGALVQTLSELPEQKTFVLCLTEEASMIISQTKFPSVIFYNLTHSFKEEKEDIEAKILHLWTVLNQLPSTVETILVEWSEALEGRSLAIAWALCHYFKLNEEWIWELGFCPNRQMMVLFNQLWQIGWQSVDFNQHYNNLNFNLMHRTLRLGSCV